MQTTSQRCPACNAWFEPSHHVQKYCGPECTTAMRKASSTCARRLLSCERSMDQMCDICGEPLGPFDMIGFRTNLPGRRRSHPECKRAFSYEVVGECEAGHPLRRRDGDCCNRCDKRERYQAAKAEERSVCAAEWLEEGKRIACVKEAAPLLDMCHKHSTDVFRFGEPRRFIQDQDWRANNFRIPQEQVREWRESILEEQGGQCALCGTAATEKWHLDHDHRCCPNGRICRLCIRAVLCRRCNQSLGNFDDDPALLRQAADYVERHLQSTPVAVRSFSEEE